MGRKLGQHFLHSKPIIQLIANSLEAEAPSTVVEVGPGKGVLTEYLLKNYKTVFAIEKDGVLVEHLGTRFEKEIKEKRLHLVYADIRDSITHKHIPKESYDVIANIPYYITGSIVRLFLSHKHQPRSMALLIQKEVAERIVKKDRGKESLLSLSVQLFGTPKYLKTVSRRYFSPQPKVSSAILLITDIHPVALETQEKFFEIISTAFSEKRKTVLKKFVGQSRTYDALVAHGVTEKTRAEDVPFTVWYQVTQASLQV